MDVIPSSISALQWPHEGKPKKTIENSKNVYVQYTCMCMYIYINVYIMCRLCSYIYIFFAHVLLGGFPSQRTILAQNQLQLTRHGPCPGRADPWMMEVMHVAILALKGSGVEFKNPMFLSGSKTLLYIFANLASSCLTEKTFLHSF